MFSLATNSRVVDKYTYSIPDYLLNNAAMCAHKFTYFSEAPVSSSIIISPPSRPNRHLLPSSLRFPAVAPNKTHLNGLLPPVAAHVLDHLKYAQ